MKQEARRDALQQGPSSDLVFKVLRQAHEKFRCHVASLAIGADRRACIGDAFTDGEAGDVWSDGLDGVTVAVETEADLLRTFS
jgi:hypothetical protein